MKKIIAILLLSIITFSVWYMGYSSHQSIVEGFLMIAIWMFFSSLGAVLGHFIFNSLLKNYLK